MSDLVLARNCCVARMLNVDNVLYENIPLSTHNMTTNVIKSMFTGKRGSAESDTSYSSMFSPRSSLATVEGSPPSAKAGTVVTSSRASKRRYCS